jgi:hypothetical protein
MKTRLVLSRPSTFRIAAIAFAALALCVVACTAGAPKPDGAQYWWKQHGPVVPHDLFPGDCKLCHVGGDWSKIAADFHYDHEKQTGFALLGAHAKAECLRCHNDRGPVQIYAARGCAGCHEDVHKGRLGRDCASCHDETSFRPLEQIAKHNQTRFPLVGVHAATACFACHPNAQVGQFAPTDAECVSCHARDLAHATNPDHAANGWIDRCDRCHIPTSWTGAGFNHFAWPLTGKHKTTACTQCHLGGVFTGAPTQCVGCHQSDYDNTTNPNHAALNISTNCAHCHNTSSWLGANFDHTGISSGCVNCHLADYNATNNPNHASAGFGLNCEQCHDTVNWHHGTFNHPQFPITSGKHAGTSCNQCHPDPANFLQFTCTNCHEHNQSKMNSEHQGVGGYVWSSPACYQCHPDGKADG